MPKSAGIHSLDLTAMKHWLSPLLSPKSIAIVGASERPGSLAASTYQQLIDTGHAEIIEDVTSRGRRGSSLFWGTLRLEDGSWEGRNTLGLLWMDLRGSLRAEDVAHAGETNEIF